MEIIISKSLFLDRFYWITDGLLVARLKCSKSHYTKTYLHTIVLRHCVCMCVLCALLKEVWAASSTDSY